MQQHFSTSGSFVRRHSEVAVEGWLDGSSAPTFRQAQRLANCLRVSFGYLFLSETTA